jgi:hypothetical protein
MDDLVVRVSRLEALVAQRDAFAKDLEVVHLQLTRAEGKLQDGETDVRGEMRIVQERIEQAEKRLRRALAGHGPGD